LVWLAGFDCDSTEIRREVPIVGGRIDILIESRSLGAIAIENKIWAAEQLDQIQTYAEHFKKGGRKFLLLYLTTYGKPSASAGTCEKDYYRISYQNHILQWLEECLRATYQYVNINQALQQYRNVVSQLTGTSSDNDYMEKVIQILKEHPAIIEHFDHITSAFWKLRGEYWRQFSDELHRQLSQRGIELGALERVTKSYSHLRFSTQFNVQATDKYELRFLVEWNEADKSFFLGASLLHYGDNQRAREEIQAACTSSQLPTQFAEEFGASYRSAVNDWWPLGYLDLIKKGDFMTNAFFAVMASKQIPITDQLKPLVDKIVRYFEIVGSEWPGTASPPSAALT
jgi:PD-(D/E)XK nuclease superfamily